MSDTPSSKRARKEGESSPTPFRPPMAPRDDDDGMDGPRSMVIQLKTMRGDSTGPPVSVPTSTTPEQLERLVNELLGNEDAVPFGFYVEKAEISGELGDFALAMGVSVESALTVEYQPLSVFRVMPVTRCIETMPGHTAPVLHVSFSPDGTILASGGGDSEVRFWDPSSNTAKHVCKGHVSHVLCTSFSPDGRLFASADRSGEVRVWDPVRGVSVGRVLKGHKAWVTSLAWEPLHLCSPSRRLASASKDKTVRVWDVASGRFLFSLSGHGDSVECVKWGGAGFIYTASRDRTIKVWATEGDARGKLVRTLEGHAHRVNTLALNTDYILRTGACTLGKPNPATTKTSSSAAAGGGGGGGVASDAELKELALERWKEARARGDERLVSGSDDFTMHLWEPETSKRPVVRMTGHQQAVNHISFSPDARFIASASFDKKVKIWDGRTGKFLITLTGHVGPVFQVSWSPDSRFLVSASRDSTVKLWKSGTASNGKAFYTLPGHADEVYALDWSPAGTKVASGSKDRTVKMWSH